MDSDWSEFIDAKAKNKIEIKKIGKLPLFISARKYALHSIVLNDTTDRR